MNRSESHIQETRDEEPRNHHLEVAAFSHFLLLIANFLSQWVDNDF